MRISSPIQSPLEQPWHAPCAVGARAGAGASRRWLVVFAFLLVAQIGHLTEHLIQAVQIYVMHVPAPAAHGLIGVLDDEWVHLVFNLWVFATVAVLMKPYGGNFWLRASLLLTGWHAIEHCYIVWSYVTTGVNNTPGLIGRHGLIFGGLPLGRFGLHMAYNLGEVLLLVPAFLIEGFRVVRAGAVPGQAFRRLRGRRSIRLGI